MSGRHARFVCMVRFVGKSTMSSLRLALRVAGCDESRNNGVPLSSSAPGRPTDERDHVR